MDELYSGVHPSPTSSAVEALVLRPASLLNVFARALSVSIWRVWRDLIPLSSAGVDCCTNSALSSNTQVTSLLEATSAEREASALSRSSTELLSETYAFQRQLTWENVSL